MRNISIVIVMALVVLVTGCASTHMAQVPDSETVSVPSADKALVIFMRPSVVGGAIQATLYDDLTYIGTISAKTRVAYETDPGEHMFMVIGESADFMKADLLAGKTYYAAVIPRIGVWKARFSFRPQNGQISEEELQSWLDDTKQVRITDEGLKWAKDNETSIRQKKADYLPKWEGKPDRDKQILGANSGR